MVKLGKIYTRGGDKGETSLVGGKRLAKHDERVAAYGTVDETTAATGLPRPHRAGTTGGHGTGRAWGSGARRPGWARRRRSPRTLPVGPPTDREPGR